ncbi:MAG: hypothetical protein GVY19_04325 [Bacteroidetes bacterium]|jgi:primosomal protein N'|nr:hypothetical protein [Bacteroidota bacterium]
MKGKQILCERCGKKESTETLCPTCKDQLVNNYHGDIDWQTAYQIELEEKEIAKLNLDFDL